MPAAAVSAAPPTEDQASAVGCGMVLPLRIAASRTIGKLNAYAPIRIVTTWVRRVASPPAMSATP